ncbi:hypothetical protein [Vibrio rotiferianus]|uniref:hypothetical protein n=1 Tax=Vibrio rotiferianus TaxID=190895 RepID=UPI00039AA083|nr:hypothetical protein [Vibrio rotiferianus]PIB15124.1 hypothetical protein B853_15380 [Vibrio rotiferianus CAIM 577 = LMG 21460]
MYRPLEGIERKIRKDYESEIYANFARGAYCEKDQIGDVLKKAFSFYEQILEFNLSKAASIDMLTFILSEYENYCEMSIRYKKGELSEQEIKFWGEYGSKTKRALKYLAEKIVAKLPNQVDDNIDHKVALSHCWIAAEEMVELYMSSQIGYSLFPEECQLIIEDSKNYNFVEFKCNKLKNAFDKLDLHGFSNNEELAFSPPFDANVQNEYFEAVFKKYFNIDYSSCLYLIQSLIGCFNIDQNDEIKYCYFEKDKMVSCLASDYSKFGLTEEQVVTLLAGFTITKDKLEDRVLYKPKQEYRALRRAFFEVEDNGKSVVLFSKSMALEELSQLVRSVSFRKLPSEWTVLDKKMSLGLDRFSNFSGSWFEDFLIKKLKENNIKCERSLKKMKVNGKNTHIPDAVGDIDVIAQVGKELHIIECKMVQFSSEPTGYIDDLDKFVYDKKSYRKKFDNKISWAEENIELLKKHLTSKGFIFSSDPVIKPIMITFYPTIVSDFIDEFLCLDVNEYLKSL